MPKAYPVLKFVRAIVICWKTQGRERLRISLTSSHQPPGVMHILNSSLGGGVTKRRLGCPMTSNGTCRPHKREEKTLATSQGAEFSNTLLIFCDPIWEF